MQRIHPSRLAAGQVLGVSAPVAGGLVHVTHVGLVADRGDQAGLPLVYNASKRTGRVTLDRWEEFCQGEPARLLDVRGDLETKVVISRAHSRLGEEWSLVWSNCEHYVRWCHGLEPESPQLQGAVGATLVLATLAVVVTAAAGAASAPSRARR